MMDLNKNNFDGATFVEEVRKYQRESGKRLSGDCYLSLKTRIAIQQAAAEILGDLRNSSVTNTDTIQLMERFEEMCRRRHYSLTASMRHPILRHLTSELKMGLM